MMPNMDEELLAENARLRQLLEDAGIDPDPVQPSDLYWVPTRLEWQLNQLAIPLIRETAKKLLEPNPLFEFLQGKEPAEPSASTAPKIGSALRIRLPVSNKVQNKPEDNP